MDGIIAGHVGKLSFVEFWTFWWELPGETRHATGKCEEGKSEKMKNTNHGELNLYIHEDINSKSYSNLASPVKGKSTNKVPYPTTPVTMMDRVEWTFSFP